jgi:solute carrier family 20 (sodium-dependent phosphate transporter)
VDDRAVVQDYYRGHLTKEQLEEVQQSGQANPRAADLEHAGDLISQGSSSSLDGSPDSKHNIAPNTEKSRPAAAGFPIVAEPEHISIVGPRPKGKSFAPAVLFWQFKRFFFRGVDQDIVGMQKKRNLLTGDLEKMHASAAHYDNKVEFMYSFLQVMTAATASFTHGANDVSKLVFSFLRCSPILSSSKC